MEVFMGFHVRYTVMGQALSPIYLHKVDFA